MKRNARNKNRRPQASKTALPERIRAEVERARSNAAGPIPSKTVYSRQPKHKNKEW